VLVPGEFLALRRDEGEAWQLWLRRHDEYGSD
jgi:hypothetical protein